jgi:ribonuclease R
MVHVTELGADYFQYDEARHELRGERTGIRYQLTDRVTVQVSRVDLDARKIDLRLVTEPGIKTVLKNEARRADSEHEKSRSRTAKPKVDTTPANRLPPGKVSKTSKVGASSAKVTKGKKAKVTMSMEKTREPKTFAKSSKRKR